MSKVTEIREIRFNKDVRCLKGLTIPKKTPLHVVNDSAPIHPSKGYKILIVRVDNGTGYLDLMPETGVRVNPKDDTPWEDSE